jgi:hypothetical protein
VAVYGGLWMAEKSRAAREGSAVVEDRIDPAFHRAILKIALELRKPSALSYDAVVEETIRKMRLDPVKFRRYLGENRARNMGLLVATARAVGH